MDASLSPVSGSRYDAIMNANDRRVLAVFGHPDDEGTVSGTLATLIARGAGATLVCATRGEVGEISDPALATPETLGYVRELELRAAMVQIGLTDVRFLGFRDSGMAGTPDNEDTRAFARQPADAVVRELVRVIREVRPHLVFTWDSEGGYGHPDHLAAHAHTLAAFDLAANAEAYPEAGAPWAPERLYWRAATMKRFAAMFFEMERRGLLPEGIEPERRERFEKAMNEPDGPVSVVVDTRAFVQQKRAAAQMHRTQFGPNSMWSRVPAELWERFFGEEHLYQARPPWPDGAEPLRGLD